MAKQILFSRADDDLGNGKRWVLVTPSPSAQTAFVLVVVSLKIAESYLDLRVQKVKADHITPTW